MKYTFKFNNNSNNFRNNNDWSKILDNIILTDVMKKNPYLKTKEEKFIDAVLKDIAPKNDDRIIIDNTRSNNDFLKAVQFLKDYTPTKNYYELADGTPVVFFEDEIQIGYDLIPRNEFIDFTSLFTPAKKKTIIDIYIKIRH